MFYFASVEVVIQKENFLHFAAIPEVLSYQMGRSITPLLTAGRRVSRNSAVRQKMG